MTQMKSNHARKHQPLQPEDELPDDLAAFKRACEARGISLRIPRRDASWSLPEPVDFGVPLGDVVIRQRGNDG
jgi:hypothetical protein